MRLLLITTDDSPVNDLTQLYIKYDVKTVSLQDLNSTDSIGSASYDLCILYGSHGLANEASSQLLLELTTTNSKPLLGVGCGFEVICRAFDADLSQLGDIETGASKLIPTDDGTKLFQGSDPLCVKDTARWSIDELPKKLTVLARSDTGIEAIHHKTLPIYALQQLPQDFVYASDAKMVFENLLAAYKIK